MLISWRPLLREHIGCSSDIIFGSPALHATMAGCSPERSGMGFRSVGSKGSAALNSWHGLWLWAGLHVNAGTVPPAGR